MEARKALLIREKIRAYNPHAKSCAGLARAGFVPASFALTGFPLTGLARTGFVLVGHRLQKT
ncbi:hypothetical protein ACU20_07225 [Actinobaculum suis]|nr:hypothetical protein ACU20_07225 [Actinobaculum suis]